MSQKTHSGLLHNSHPYLLILALVAISLTSLYSYLFFHSVAELFSIVVAFSIFIIGWASRKSMKNGYFLFLGIAFLFIAGLDTLHMLAYKGMGVFSGDDANLPTQLWIATRYLQALVLIAAPFFLYRTLRPRWVFTGFSLVTLFVVASIFYRVFPVAYIEGIGLTPFKILSEYIIAAILLGSMLLLWRNRGVFDPAVLRWLMIFIAMNILSEISFTNYVSLFGPANLLGHTFKIVAFYCLFQAIVDTGFYRPFDLLLRDLKLNEDELRLAQAELEKRVEERTQQLIQTNAELSEVQRRLMDSKEAERLSLARELHDGPIQELISASLQLQQINMDLPVKEAEEIASVQELISQVSQTLRTVCTELRPHVLTSFGLERAIQSHAEQFQQEHPELNLHLDFKDSDRKPPEQTTLALFRIYQQALTNIVRHARASQVTIRYSADGEGIVFQVEDNGVGFEVPRRWITLVREGHLGLAGISERAEAVGGKFTVSSNPGEGTCIQVRVPWSVGELPVHSTQTVEQRDAGETIG